MKNFTKQLHLFYLERIINSFAGGLYGIFIPIYFLSLGIGLNQVFIFYIAYTVTVFLFSFVAGYFASCYGLKNTIALNFPFLFLFLLGLWLLPQVNISLILLGIASGLSAAFYWFGHHVFFTKVASLSRMGDSVGKLYAFPKFISIFSPLAGGLISYFFGFISLFVITFIIYLFSFIPLIFLDKFKVIISFKPKKVWQFVKNYPGYLWAEIFKNIGEEIEDVILPIFVFLMFRNTISIGALGTLLGIGGAIFTLIVGKYTDKTKRRKLLISGALAIIVIWLVRYFYSTQAVLLISSIFVGFFVVLISIPFYSTMYKLAKGEKTDEFIVFREIPVFVGRIFVYLLALVFIDRLDLSFIVAALSNIYFLFW